MIKEEIEGYQLTQTGEAVQAILNKASNLPNEIIADKFLHSNTDKELEWTNFHTKQTAIIASTDWNEGVATCTIEGLRIDSDPTQIADCFFTDNLSMLAAKPWFSCTTANQLTIACQGTTPTASTNIVVVMTEV